MLLSNILALILAAAAASAARSVTYEETYTHGGKAQLTEIDTDEPRFTLNRSLLKKLDYMAYDIQIHDKEAPESARWTKWVNGAITYEEDDKRQPVLFDRKKLDKAERFSGITMGFSKKIWNLELLFSNYRCFLFKKSQVCRNVNSKKVVLRVKKNSNGLHAYTAYESGHQLDQILSVLFAHNYNFADRGNAHLFEREPESAEVATENVAPETAEASTQTED